MGVVGEKPGVVAGKQGDGGAPLPEIAGDAALTFDPANIHDIGGRLLEIINDPAQRGKLIAAARRRKALFSARKIAVETLSLYRRVHEALYSS